MELDEYQRTPLHYAAKHDDESHIQLLIGHCYCNGDQAFQQDRYGATALHVAAQHGKTRIVEILLSTFPDLLLMCDHDGRTAFHLALERGNLKLANKLLEIGGLIQLDETALQKYPQQVMLLNQSRALTDQAIIAYGKRTPLGLFAAEPRQSHSEVLSAIAQHDEPYRLNNVN